ncbi:hypothetical protein E4U43_001006 [Claviceps pusilla]|uniref:Transcription factor TFIIIC triple barrel domain-containing protein n=1 Tax=Claviceps pusilla TaxID=123648 RepID=A0A9P7N915_9HYPO|nr:hypothetical protein E4U43_001006 [Claviceps pusilla]
MDKPAGVFTSNDPGALPLDQVLAGIIKDDQEEWEYEYSTTETETFYLTLELSYPDFKERSTKAYHHSRGGYYKNWQDHDPSAANNDTKQTSKATDVDNANINTKSDDDGDGDGEDEDEGAHYNDIHLAERDEEDDGTLLDPALRTLSKGKEPANSATTFTEQAALHGGNSAKGRDDENDAQGEEQAMDGDDKSTETEDVQILELHSRNPLISYRGRLFEGKWAEVIGTEAIFAPHDSSDPLPALRNLPGDIDLLAASSSRILTTEKIVKPKVPEQDTLAPIKKEWNIRIPVGKDKTGERAEQTNFLENLIALKMKRGDRDQVTVYATDGAGKDWDDRKGMDFKPRRRRAAAGEEAGDYGSEKCKTTEQQQQQASVRRNLEGYPVGFGDGVAEPRGLSTPTPKRWEDLT